MIIIQLTYAFNCRQHLGCFLFSAVASAMNIYAYVFYFSWVNRSRNAGHMVSIPLLFQKYAIFHSDHTIFDSHHQCESSACPTSSPTVGIIGLQWYFIVVLNCISLIVKMLSIYVFLLAIHVITEKKSVLTFHYFLLGCLITKLKDIFTHSGYKILIRYVTCKYFSHSI